MESVHPLLVHFPIALILAAWLMDLLGIAARRPLFRRVSTFNLGLGVAGAAAAILSGLKASEIAKHSFEIHEVMELHQKMGIIVGIWAGILFLWRLLKPEPLAVVTALRFALFTLLVGALAFGSHLGGRLVYEFGVGGTFGKTSTVIHVAPHTH